MFQINMEINDTLSNTKHNLTAHLRLVFFTSKCSNTTNFICEYNSSNVISYNMNYKNLSNSIRYIYLYPKPKTIK